MSLLYPGKLTPRFYWPGQTRDDWVTFHTWACDRYGRIHPIYGEDHPEYRDPDTMPAFGHWQEPGESFLLPHNYPYVTKLMNTRAGNPRPVVAELGLQAISAAWNAEPLAKTQETNADLWVTPTDYVAACAELQRMCQARDEAAEPIIYLQSGGEAWVDGKIDPDLSGGFPDFIGVENAFRWAERMAHYAIEKGVPWITVDAHKKVWAVDPDNEWTEPEWAH